MFKTYSQLIKIPTFEERYEYLKLGGEVGAITFGHDRYLNQILYHSDEWQETREKIIIRDDSRDLGIYEFLIFRFPLVHHINPITADDIKKRNPIIFDHENLITTSRMTHNAIHYGDKSKLPKLPQERQRGDTTLWKTLQ